MTDSNSNKPEDKPEDTPELESAAGEGARSDVDAVTDEMADDKLDAADEPAAGQVDEGVVTGDEPTPLVAAQPRSKLAFFALLLALAGLGAAGYVGWTQLQQGESGRSIAQQVGQHQKQVQTLQADIASNQQGLVSQLAERDQQLVQLKASLLEAELSLDAHSRRLLALTATTTDDWRLAEVEYLLRLANQRLMTSRDGKTALQLLQASDAILLELADPRLFKVRKAIANDRAAIAAVGEYDTDGVFLELSALSAQVKDLQTLVMPEFQAQPATGESESEESSLPKWLQPVAEIGQSTWRELKALVVIQRVDEPIKPLLPPDQQFFLKNNLRLLLSQAQLALLDGREQVYQSALENAAAWLGDYFPQQHAANQSMLEALQRLKSLPVSQEFPDVSESLLAIKAFITEQHRMASGETDSRDAIGKKAATKEDKGE